MKRLMATLALGLTTLAGVAAAQEPQRLPPTVTADTVANLVSVQNQRNAPVTIYLDYGRFDRRLGIIPAFGAATLPLPAWAVKSQARVKLFAHVDGEARDLSTQEFALRAPGRIGMVIPPREVIATAAPDTMEVVLAPDELDEATLTVDNQRNTMVTVYAEMGRFDVRLGRVPARTRTTLRFPSSAVGANRSIQIFVNPDGGADLSSQSFSVTKGQHLALRVPEF